MNAAEVAALLGLVAVVLLVMTMHPVPNYGWLAVGFGRDLDPASVESLLRSLATDRSLTPVAFELHASARSVRFLIGAPSNMVDGLARRLRQFCPGVTVEAVERPPVTGWAWRLTPSTTHRPLLTDSPDVVSRSILAGLDGLARDERVVVQWVLGARTSSRSVPNRLNALPGQSITAEVARALLASEQKVDGEAVRALRVKTAEPGFRVTCRVAVTAANIAAGRALAQRVVAGVRVAEAPGVTIRVRREPVSRLAAAAPGGSVLNVREVVAVLGWPYGEVAYPGVERLVRSSVPIPAGMPSSGRVFAVSTFPGTEGRPLAISPRDALQHLHVVGPTGAGKSTLLLHLILADIEAGRGVVVIDPKGDLVTDILARIPMARRDDVVLLDPADDRQPVGLNPLALDGRPPELVADQILAVFHGLYRDNWGPRTQDILHASLLTLAGQPDVTLCSLPVLLANPAYRRRLVARIEDQVALKPFWAWYESISDGERHQAIAPVMNKLRAFLLRPRMRAVIGQPAPKFRVGSVFTDRTILLASLGKGVIGPEASALLGSLIVSQVWHAALGRAVMPVERRAPVFGYIDEFQDYLHLPTDLADVLAQARGLGFGLTLAHQFMRQLTPEVNEAVMANARSRICFQLGQRDAATFARSSTTLDDSDFMGLAAHEVYAQIVVDGTVTPYASGRTLPPPPATDTAEVVREASRRRYGTTINEVEASLAALVAGAHDDDAPVGRRPRRQP